MSYGIHEYIMYIMSCDGWQNKKVEYYQSKKIRYLVFYLLYRHIIVVIVIYFRYLLSIIIRLWCTAYKIIDDI